MADSHPRQVPALLGRNRIRPHVMFCKPTHSRKGYLTMLTGVRALYPNGRRLTSRPSRPSRPRPIEPDFERVRLDQMERVKRWLECGLRALRSRARSSLTEDNMKGCRKSGEHRLFYTRRGAQGRVRTSDAFTSLACQVVRRLTMSWCSRVVRDESRRKGGKPPSCSVARGVYAVCGRKAST